jgi:hypothetical protein
MFFIKKSFNKVQKLIKKFYKKEKRNNTDDTLYENDNWNHIKHDVCFYYYNY